MSYLLELNDWQLSCFDATGACLYRQAAAAVEHDNSIVFGNAAMTQSRTNPQKFSANFLSRLNTETLPQTIGAAQNHADLIYHQLQALKLELQMQQMDEVIVATPAHYTDEQLGLLLGITDAAGIKVRGFVDSALAHYQPNSSRYHVLDIGLNHAYLSELQTVDQHTQVVGSMVLDRIGVINVVDAWLQVIASTFMQSSRFDPLHSAESEQQVFDQAFGWVNGDLPTDPNITVNVDGVARKSDITVNQLRSALQKRLPQTELAQIEHLLLTPRAASIPGLQELLSNSLESVTACKTDVLAWLQIQQRSGHSEPVRITQRQSVTSPVGVATATNEGGDTMATDTSAQASQPPATHLLANHLAIPLTDGTLRSYFDEDGLLRPGADVSVNDAAPTRARLRCADQVQVLGQSWVAIRVDE